MLPSVFISLQHHCTISDQDGSRTRPEPWYTVRRTPETSSNAVFLRVSPSKGSRPWRCCGRYQARQRVTFHASPFGPSVDCHLAAALEAPEPNCNHARWSMRWARQSRDSGRHACRVPLCRTKLKDNNKRTAGRRRNPG